MSVGKTFEKAFQQHTENIRNDLEKAFNKHAEKAGDPKFMHVVTMVLDECFDAKAVKKVKDLSKSKDFTVTFFDKARLIEILKEAHPDATALEIRDLELSIYLKCVRK